MTIKLESRPSEIDAFIYILEGWWPSLNIMTRPFFKLFELYDKQIKKYNKIF